MKTTKNKNKTANKSISLLGKALKTGVSETAVYPTFRWIVRQRTGHESLPQKQVGIYDRAQRQITSFSMGRSRRVDASGYPGNSLY